MKKRNFKIIIYFLAAVFIFLTANSATDISDINCLNKKTKSRFVKPELTVGQAGEIALKKSGGGDITKCEIDYDDGYVIYEIEVLNSNIKYEFEIDGMTGDILESESKIKNKPRSSKTLLPSMLNAEEAETIVLNHAGFTKSNVSFVKFGNYDKRGKMLYDIEFLTDSKKYSYKIDAVTGQIISYHVKQR